MTEQTILQIAEKTAELISVAMQKQWFHTKEASEYLGVAVSTLHKMTMNGDIAFSKPNGKECVFNRKDLDEWLNRNRTERRVI